jgi:dolichol-phosphate mannosyltransferase
MRTVIFLLPVYNEAARLEALLERIRATGEREQWDTRVVAVNDGSGDDSGTILVRQQGQMPLEIVTHRYNRGLGETLRDGFEWVGDHAAPDAVIVTMDADDTHDPSYVTAMLEKIDAGADVVIASRFQPGAEVRGVPQHRELFSSGAYWLLQTSLRIPGVRDYACGYRAIRASIIQAALRRFGGRLIELREWGFICTAEVLWKLSRCGARCDEIPFVLRYDLKASPSKMRAARTIAGYGLLAWQGLRVRMAGAS